MLWHFTHLLLHHAHGSFWIIFYFCVEQTRTHTEPFPIAFFWNRVAQVWKLRNIPLPHQPAETLAMTVLGDHNRRELTLQLGGFPHPSLLSMRHVVPSWFLHLAHHSWKPASKEACEIWKSCLGNGSVGRRLMWLVVFFMRPGRSESYFYSFSSRDQTLGLACAKQVLYYQDIPPDLH